MRITAFIQYCAVAIGMIGVIAGKYMGLPKGIELGLSVMAVGFLFAGLQAIFTRQMSMRFSDFGWDNWMGGPSIIVGLMQLFVAAILLGCAYEYHAARWPILVDFFASRPGPVLAALGLLVFATGLLVVIMADRFGGKLRFMFVAGPQIISGLAILTLGVAIFGAGVWEWFHHPSFERFTERTAQQLNLPSPGQLWRSTASDLK